MEPRAISGTTWLEMRSLDARARTQGTIDRHRLAGAGGGLSSGLIITATSYATLTITGGILGLLIVPGCCSRATAASESGVDPMRQRQIARRSAMRPLEKGS